MGSVRSRRRRLLFDAAEVERGGRGRERLIRAVVDVHQAEVEIFTIVSAVSGFVVILEPIGADDIRGFD